MCALQPTNRSAGCEIGGPEAPRINPVAVEAARIGRHPRRSLGAVEVVITACEYVAR